MRNASETQAAAETITTATFKVPRGLLEDFRSIAGRHERSLSQELRKVMADHVASHEDNHEPDRSVA